jgi:prepilin-type N-terminal cleavage/methylation domain-containing protein
MTDDATRGERRPIHGLANARGKSGFTLVELMVAMTIGSVALAALLSLLSSASHALATRESVAEMQERARYALASIETDVQLAGYYGLSSRGSEFSFLSGGTSVATNAQLRQTAAPLTALGTGAQSCGDNFAVDMSLPLQGDDNRFQLGVNRRAACAARGGGARTGTDTLTIRRGNTTATTLDANRLQLLVNRLDDQQRWLLTDATQPAGFILLANLREVHDVMLRSYYVSNDSVGTTAAPALRVKELTRVAGRVDFTDTEVMPGIEDLQVLFVTDAGTFAPESLPPASIVLAARIWVLARAASFEVGYVDPAIYTYAGRTTFLSATERRYRRVLLTRLVTVRNAHAS